MAKPKAEAEPKVDLLGQLRVQLDAEYMLRPSREAISNIEHALGKSLPQMMLQCGSYEMPLAGLGVCVAEMMKAHGTFNPDSGLNYRDPKPAVIADLIYENDPVAVSRRLAIIFSNALTGGYTASGETKAAGMKTTEPTPTAD